MVRVFGSLSDRFSLGLTVGFCFPGGLWSRVVSLSVTGMWLGLGRLRLWMYVFCG